MPLVRNTATNIIDDLPQNIIDHPVLGRDLELYVPDCEGFEEDKVVSEAPVSTQRLIRTATPKTDKTEETE